MKYWIGCHKLVRFFKVMYNQGKGTPVLIRMNVNSSWHISTRMESGICQADRQTKNAQAAG